MPLRYVKECRLHCDGCRREYEHSPDFSAGHLAKSARLDYWAICDTEWFCPVCAHTRRLDSPKRRA